MSKVFAKLRQSNKRQSLESYKMVLSTDDTIYQEVLDNTEFEFDKYTANRKPEDNLWFYIENFSNQPYADLLIIHSIKSSELSELKKDDFDKLELLAIDNDKCIFYQRITKSKLIMKKGFFWLDSAFRYQSEDTSIRFNSYPDAIYERSSNRLYFKKLNTISNIFIGINELYREATEDEIKSFLNNNFIVCSENFNYKTVSISNRKRIAQVIERMNELRPEQIDELLDYIKPYCQNMFIRKHLYRISNDKELKLILDGFCENYYTKPISNEKTLAHSTSKI